MSCCAPGVEAAAEFGRDPSAQELKLASREVGEGLYQTDLAVPGVHCAVCIQKIERGLSRLAGVEYARVNLSTKRVSVKWRGEIPPPMIQTLAKLGYPAHLFEAEGDKSDPELWRLIRALGVAGFCAMNIMLLSISVWSGADAQTRQAFHLISGALALPALLYSAQIFFRSAWGVLKNGRTNMDVPISIGITLAFCLSLYDTFNNGEHAYFDAVTTLIFFLLVGRTLDHVMREKARAAVRGLIRLTPRGATVLRDNGSRDYLRVDEIEPGMQIFLAAGDRVPVDGEVRQGVSEVDCALVTGESAARHVERCSEIRAGTLNLTGPLTMVAHARAQDSFLAEMVRLMEAAEGGRAHYRRLADRAARLYSPLVHTAALLTFLGWMVATGNWHRAVGIAIAVLIITCPCALGLAVPIVQVVAARRLFENGIMVKDGSGIERLAEIDTVVFDKTGTLTLGRPRLVNASLIDKDALHIAATMSAQSRHPLSTAIAAASSRDSGASVTLTGVMEYPGFGMEAHVGDARYRLGRAEWALANDASETGTVLTRNGDRLASFVFADDLRPDAKAAIDALRRQGLNIAILSGDELASVAMTAQQLDIADYSGGLLPGAKVERLAALSAAGHNTLMIGDGLNDAPALAAAHVSMAPATAADIGRNAADFVFLYESLNAVPRALSVAHEAGRLVRQNFALAIGYNIIALPVAISGAVTPLIAALAMSFSSVVVVTNAMRLKSGRYSDAVRSHDISPVSVTANPELAK